MRLEPSNVARRALAPLPTPHAKAASNVARLAPALAPAPVQNDRLLRYDELSAAQKHLLGPSGAQTYLRLSSDNRAVFLLLTRRMDRAGLDYGGLTLKDPLTTIRRNRLLFNPDPAGLARFRASGERSFSQGNLIRDKVFEPFHRGMADWGMRENRRKWSIQLGVGPAGAFVDVDRYNPKADWKAWLGHAGEIIHPGRPDPLKIARELGEDLNTRTATPRRAA